MSLVVFAAIVGTLEGGLGSVERLVVVVVVVEFPVVDARMGEGDDLEGLVACGGSVETALCKSLETS